MCYINKAALPCLTQLLTGLSAEESITLDSRGCTVVLELVSGSKVHLTFLTFSLKAESVSLWLNKTVGWWKAAGKAVENTGFLHAYAC